jgi:hypothetical protein
MSGLEDKVDELEPSDNDKQKIITYKLSIKELMPLKKTKPTNHGHRRRIKGTR